MFNLKQNQEAKVETINDSEQKVLIEYPCNWCYKVIASEKAALEQAIRDVIDAREHTITPSNKSKTGKYISMNLDLLVHNEDDRTFIFEALKKHQNIKMVL
jgi:putative lipoic acid-binding regulatory protein